MIFLSPAFFWGLLALAIPVIIHLFNFRKTRRVYFTNTRFLQNVKEASTTRLKLKHWLILATRLLALFFLVMAFAQPFIPADQNRSEVSDIVIYLDNSMSMTNEVDIDQTALEAGINYVYQILEMFPQDTRFKLLTNDFAPYSNSFKSKEEVLDLTTAVKPTGLARSSGDIMRRITSDPDISRSSMIFWVSDFQKSTLGELDVLSADSSFNINLVPLNFNSTSNVLIDSVFLDKNFLMEGDRLSLNVVIRNSGDQAREGVIVKVFVNDIQTANATVDLGALGEQTLNFQLGTGIERINRCRVSIEEYPVTFDNDFYFSINLLDRIKVVEIRPDEESTPIAKVYGNEQLFNFSSFPSGSIDYSQLNAADLIVIAGLNRLETALTVSLREYVDQGGGVVIMPGSEAELPGFRQLLMNRPLSKPDSAIKMELAAVNTQNPFFENVFETDQQNIIMPEATQVLSWGRDRNGLLSFKNGMPFVSRILQGEGELYLFACAMEDDLTSLHLNALFVPLMYKIAAESINKRGDLYYYLSQQLINVPLDSIRREKIFNLAGNQQEIVPSQRIVGDKVLLELPGYTLEPGFYDLVDEDRVLTTLAFNINRSESELAQQNRDDLSIRFNMNENINIFSSDNLDEFNRQLKANYMGTPLWKYAIVLALLFLLSEIILIRIL